MQTASSSLTREDYLAREESSHGKHEFFQGEIFAMTGGTFNHAAISGNVYASLKRRLRGQGCTPMNSDMRVHTPAGLDTYPDVSVFCGNPELIDHRRTLLNPVLIVEVLSPSTSSYDRGDKFKLYRSLPSLQDYLLVDSEQVWVEHFRRTEENEWVLHVYRSPSDSVALRSIGETLAVSELYDDVVFVAE